MSPPEACRPRTSASAAARSIVRIRSAVSRSRARSICRPWARSPTTTATRRMRRRTGHGSAGRATTAGAWRASCGARKRDYRWFLEQLVVVRDDERTRLGYVTRVAFDTAERACDVAHALAGQPRSMPVRPTSIAFAEELPLPALMLSATEEAPVSLIVPPRTFTPGRLLRSMDTGPERKFRLTKLLQRGGDFERVAFEETRRRLARARSADARWHRAYESRRMPNRLADATSPYLQQHADNPVDWYPWGEEALAQARAEGKPILLSIGYSACHWCHVMAHESFEDPGVAARHERRVRERQGRSRGASRPRPDLPDRARAADAPVGRLAAHRCS